MRFILFLTLSSLIFNHARAIEEDEIPKALIVEHTWDKNGGDNINSAPNDNPPDAPSGDYTGTYIYEGEFNGSPYWVQNNCIGEMTVKECRCYIYKQINSDYGDLWVLVPQPPGTNNNDFLANGVHKLGVNPDKILPWMGKWEKGWGGKSAINKITINNDIDLNKARKNAKINACPVSFDSNSSLDNLTLIAKQKLSAEQKTTYLNLGFKINETAMEVAKELNIESQKIKSAKLVDRGNIKMIINDDLNQEPDGRIGEELDRDNEYNASDKDRRIITPDSEINIIREEQLAQKGNLDNQKSLSVIEVQNGGVYMGDTKNGQPHGIGIIRFEEQGIVYFGEWEQGSPNGEGIKYEKESDDFYFGEFKNAQKDGKGNTYYVKSSIEDIKEKMLNIKFKSKQDIKFWISNIQSAVTSYTKLTKYSGDFKNNLMHGQGILKYEDSSLYSGTFFKDFPNRQGKKSFVNGDYYEGNFKDGNPSGKGILKSGDGSEYIGEFRDGLANGKGRKRFPDRTVYSGEFKDGDANGRGTFTDKLKNKFTGLWRDGKLIKEDKVKDKK